MKHIIGSILFLFAVVWGWNTIGEYVAPVKSATEVTESSLGVITHSKDQTISVLVEACCYADVSVRTVNTFSPNVSRRYRPGEFFFDKLFGYFEGGQAVRSDSILKNSYGLSQEYAARLKYTGYYIYTLRKIVI